MSLHASRSRFRLTPQFVLLAMPLVLAGCSGVPLSATQEDASSSKTRAKGGSAQPALPAAGSGRGGYYLDDGPGDSPPEGLMDVPDAEPKIEPYANRGNKPYSVFGKTYTPDLAERPLKQRGVGSWYGKKFHGQKTSSGEPYDMYKMTAAHPTLPIPSYARVTNLANGRQVIVRVNDRGPFHSSRIIDLSYTAALKLGYLGKGSSELEVERILPEEIARMNKGKGETLARADKPAVPQEIPAVVAMPVNLGGPEQPRQLEVPQAPSPVVVASPQAVSGQGFYLQLGAYAQMANAEAARIRLQGGQGASLPPLEVVEYNKFFRVYGGPFGSREEAEAVARQLQEGGMTKPMVVQR